MRLLIFSDWHSQSIDTLIDTVKNLEQPLDLILYAGDDLERFEETEDRANVFSELAGYTREGKVLAVAGNRDSSISKEVLEADGARDLHLGPIEEGEYVFLGLEATTDGHPGLSTNSENDIGKHLQQQYEGFEDSVPILVSHLPPEGILDIGQRFGQRHIGSRAVRDFIEEYSPLLTVCGHCHQFGGRSEEGEFGTVINIASDDDRDAPGRYGIVELDGDEIEYDLRMTGIQSDSELKQLSQVGSKRSKQFEEAGITVLNDVTEQNREKMMELPGVHTKLVNMWIEEAEAIQNDDFILSEKEEFEVLDREDAVLFDIETDLEQDHIWLIGLYNYSEDEFVQFFEKEDEEKLLRDFLGYLDDLNSFNLVYYGNNYFDERCLNRKIESHGLGDQKDILDESTDLGFLVHHQLLGSFERSNLETISEALAGYQYKYPDMNGLEVGRNFTRYKLDGEVPDWEKMLEYSKDDVMAMKAVVDVFREMFTS